MHRDVSWMIARATALVISLVLPACSGRPSHVEILASVRADAPGGAWALEKTAYDALGAVLFGPAQHVVVTPISDLSATEASIFDESVEADSLMGDNPLQIKERATAIRREYADVFSKLDARHVGRPRTEIISAVVASAARFQDDAPTTDKVLMILSTGFEQSGAINMGDVNLSLRASTPAILQALHHRDLIPNLHGVKVCMAGITSGNNGWADANASLAIKSFWEEYFREAGAHLIGFSPSISATCLAAVRRIDLFSGTTHAEH